MDKDIYKMTGRKILEKLYREKCYIDPKTGYYRFKDSGIYVHRWIMQRTLNRRLRPGEVVHHLNGNKLDNHHSNLLLLEDQDEHDDWHQTNFDDSGVW